MGLSGIIIVLGMLVPLAVGILLIVRSRRRGPDHAACGGCGYDVSRTVGTAARCPECGAAFVEVGITPPRGRRNPIMVVAGVSLVVASVTCFGSGLLAQRAAMAQERAARLAAERAAVAQQAAMFAQEVAQARQEAAEAAAEREDVAEDSPPDD